MDANERKTDFGLLNKKRSKDQQMKETKTAKSTVRQEFGRIWRNELLAIVRNITYRTQETK